jgi:hypothetical protein
MFRLHALLWDVSVIAANNPFDVSVNWAAGLTPAEIFPSGTLPKRAISPPSDRIQQFKSETPQAKLAATTSPILAI